MIKIPFRYLAFPADSLSNPLSEEYLAVLESSDFDLTYPPNFEGIPTDPYNGSFVCESYNFPTNGAYHLQIFLKRDAPLLFVTPRGATLTVGGGGAGSLGGFFISHFTELPDQWSFWPDGSDFVAPEGYDACVYDFIGNPDPQQFRDWCSTKETSALNQTVRFLDAENEGHYVKGAAADGRSQVIVELDDVQNSADVTMPDGDGTWVSDATLQNGVWRRTWQAPESYGGSADDNTEGQRLIGFAVVIDGQSLSPAFYLRKAPVVMLHGLWSNASIWHELENALRAGGFPPTPAVSHPPEASFTDNAQVTSSRVALALAPLQAQDYVAKKADIVAHSMGGCLAKLYGSSDYIRRIVTIGTPHNGSPVADLFCNNPLGSFLLSVVGRSKNGALYDLTTSRCHVSGDKLGVPVLAINGIAAPNRRFAAFSDAWSYLAALQVLLNDYNLPDVHHVLFGNDTSDWVVSGTSQMGGLTGNSVTSVNVTWHVDEPVNSDVINTTVAFLDAPSDSVGAMLAQQMAPLAKSQPAPHEPSVRQLELYSADLRRIGHRVTGGRHGFLSWGHSACRCECPDKRNPDIGGVVSRTSSSG